jgi:hypothetical protein
MMTIFRMKVMVASGGQMKVWVGNLKRRHLNGTEMNRGR